MAQEVELARQDLSAAAQIDPSSPLPHAFSIEVAMLHPQMPRQDGVAAFQQATARHPTNLLALRKMLRFAAKKWGGSHEEQVGIARWVASRAPLGSDALGALYYAHVEIWFYKKQIEGDLAAAKAYRTDSAIDAELGRLFDAWLCNDYRPGPFSPLALHPAACWYFMMQDAPRLSRVLAALGEVPHDYPWLYLGEPRRMLERATAFAKFG
jgi:hypothetical protein